MKGKQEQTNRGLFDATCQEMAAMYERFCDERNPGDNVVPSHALEKRMNALLQSMRRAERYRYYKRSVVKGAVASGIVLGSVWFMNSDIYQPNLLQPMLHFVGSRNRVCMQLYRLIEEAPLIKLPTYLPAGFSLEDAYSEQNRFCQVFCNGNWRIVYEQTIVDPAKGNPDKCEHDDNITVNSGEGGISHDRQGYKLAWTDGTSDFRLIGACTPM